MIIPQNNKKTLKRYKLYCPDSFDDITGEGYNTFDDKYYKREGNSLEQLIRLAAMMYWYQIVDRRDKMKVINDKSPEN